MGLNVGLLPQVGLRVGMDLPVGVATPQAGSPVWQSLLWSKFLCILGPVHETHASYILTIEFPSCYRNTIDHESLLIIDSGASVCITPHRLDFITYKMSNIKIKDLSSSNTVAGEGLLRWKVEDCAGRIVNLDLPGYHIPGAEVCLLSPQVILSVFGGHTTQTTQIIEVCLANGLVLDADLCPQSCLLLFPFVPGGSKLSSFWTYAFA